MVLASANVLRVLVKVSVSPVPLMPICVLAVNEINRCFFKWGKLMYLSKFCNKYG
jgi:hypothetical protein